MVLVGGPPVADSTKALARRVIAHALVRCRREKVGEKEGVALVGMVLGFCTEDFFEERYDHHSRAATSSNHHCTLPSLFWSLT